jgi:hypothetical protein
MCIESAPSCGHLQWCGIGPVPDAGPQPDSGVPPTDRFCFSGCLNCVERGRCDDACRPGLQLDCISVALSCAAIEACLVE